MAKPRRPRSGKTTIKMGFDDQTLLLRLDQISPLKILPPAARESEKFKRILASIREIGIIEPLVVTPHHDLPDKYLLLDGHMRLQILKDMGETETICLISHDDETFTYNKHVSRLAPIQEHKMIVQAVKRGVPEEKIAKALDLDVSSIVRKRDLLAGICAEVAELLKEQMVAADVFVILRKMKPYRQIEAATLMNDANIYTVTYAKALLGATPRDQLTDPSMPKKIKGLDDEQMARMESEMASLNGEYQLIEENYGKDVLNLTLAKGYLVTLLGNVRVVRYLAQHHAEILTQFQKIAEMTSLNAKEITT